MKKYRDFKCEHCQYKFDERVEDDTFTIACPSCEMIAERTASSPRVKGNTTGGSPSFSNKKW